MRNIVKKSNFVKFELQNLQKWYNKVCAN